MGVDLQTYRATIGTYRHSYGVDVVTIVVCVNFSHGVKTVGSVLFISILLIIAGVEQNPGPWESDEASISEDDIQYYSDALPCYKDTNTSSQNVQQAKIEVKQLPKGVTDEMLLILFENEKRQGGGPVKMVTVDSDKHIAIVEFKEAKAVELVMKKLPIVILNTEVKVQVLNEDTSIENIRPKEIEVRQLPKHANEEILTNFFENERRQGGGPVKSVTLDSNKHIAIVEFEEATAVELVMKKLPIVILGTEVNIHVFKSNVGQQTRPMTDVALEKQKTNIDEVLRTCDDPQMQKGDETSKQKQGTCIDDDKRKVELDLKRKESNVGQQTRPMTDVALEKQKTNIDEVLRTCDDPQMQKGDETSKQKQGTCIDDDKRKVELDLKRKESNVGQQTRPMTDVALEKQKTNIDEVLRTCDDPQMQKGDETSKQKQGTCIDDDKRKVELDLKRKESNVGQQTRPMTDVALEKQKTNIDEVLRTCDDPQMQKGDETSKQKQGTCIDDDKRKVELDLKRKESNVGQQTRPMTDVALEKQKTNIDEVLRTCDDPQMQKGDETSKQKQGTCIDDDKRKVELDLKRKESNVGQQTRPMTDVALEKQKTNIDEASVLRTCDDPQMQKGDETSKQKQGTCIDDDKRKVELDLKRKESNVGQQTRPMTDVALEKQKTNIDEVLRTCDDPQMQKGDETSKQKQGTCIDDDKRKIEIDLKRKDSQQSDGQAFHQILLKLELKDKYPGKISIQDVIYFDPNETTDQKRGNVSLANIPWIMLKQLMCAHSEARDITFSMGKDNENDITLDNAMPEESDEISTVDIFTAVFQCCDPFMKQILFKKLYLCKLALPFLYKHWETNESYLPMLSVWPLRFLAIENRLKSNSNQLISKELDFLELKTKVLAFARFGRPLYSKSKLLNGLLSNQGCKTFFNIDCPSGMSPRFLSKGNIELFLLSTIGDNKDRFQDAMTFLNMRGDLNENFSEEVLSFVANFVDAITIFIDVVSISKRREEAKAILLNFTSVILVITSPLNPQEMKDITNFKQEVLDSKPNISIRVMNTHKGIIQKNKVDMISSVTHHITCHLKETCTYSFQARLKTARNEMIKTDEQENNCVQGKVEAEKLVEQMKLCNEPRSWKQCLTPVHSVHTRKLGKLVKDREREKDFRAGEILDSKIKEIRKLQTQSITETVHLFINVLLKYEKSHLKLNIFLCWLHFYIEREKRNIMPELMYNNRCELEKLKTLKSKRDKGQPEIECQETIIKQSEEEIDRASFSVEHFFREIGHIYEAILELNEISTKLQLPPVDRMSTIIGNLVINGHQLEIIDGESFYMPYLWTFAVFKQIDKRIDTSKVMTLSVLGLQGSGKSTLLNTMFGSCFSTRTGRCTRGIHVQLIPVKFSSHDKTLSPFKFVLIADTEGLRSPELGHVQHVHDNELATVITGLADAIMMNVMGENTSEIRDILQVVVHAFLRLKMANHNLDIRNSCTFIFQNVTDNSASDNMLSGLSSLIQILDEMTRESARSEGILDIMTFNEVIEFDIDTHVWYLTNLWQGNPPMARVNNDYNDKVAEIKCKLIQKALQMKNKSYKSLSDTIRHTHSVWKGILNENFIFSFRNCLEIRAYLEMERLVQDQLWQLECHIRECVVKETLNKFASCNKKEQLRDVASELRTRLYDSLDDTRHVKEEAINTYFEKSKYADIIIHWKNRQHQCVENLCNKLKINIEKQISKNLVKRSVEILTVSNHETHEEELSKMSIEVANRYKEKDLTKDEIDELFSCIWQTFITKVDTCCYTEQNRRHMREVFIECLGDLFVNDKSLLGKYLKKVSNLEPIPSLEKLEGSFKDTRVKEKHISFSNTSRRNILPNHAFKIVTEQVNIILETVDQKIKRIRQISDEITEMSVKELLHYFYHSIHELIKGDTGYDFKTPFYVKLCVHVSRFTHPVFEKHNEYYFKTQGIDARLEQYRIQQRLSFEAHLKNRKSEDLAAELFNKVIENFAEEWTLQNLSIKVTDELYSAVPCVKNRVIIEICTELLEKENFEHFITYLNTPKEHASTWITNKANSLLFDDKTAEYKTVSNKLINSIFKTVRKCVNNLKHSYTIDATSSNDFWINDFQESLKGKGFSIPPEIFRNIQKVKQIENIKYLTDKILDNLDTSEEILKDKFGRHTSDSVKWTGTNPIDRIIKKVWGCSERCAFCGEPCAKNEDHDGSAHYSIQHRPPGCLGIRKSDTQEAALESCEFKVHSHQTHSCGVFKNICSNKTEKSCGKIHHYRNYKACLPNWDITPTSNMHNTSKFWMWFMATYKRELNDYYECSFDTIPSSWYDITKDVAKESLHETYSA